MKAQLHELWNFCLSTLILKPTIHTIHSYIFWWKYICFYGNVAANEVVYIYMYFKFLILKATNAFVLAQLQHFHIDLMLMFSFTTSGIWFILHNVHVTVQHLCPYVQINLLFSIKRIPNIIELQAKSTCSYCSLAPTSRNSDPC